MALAALSAMSRSASPTSLGCFVTASSLLQPHTRTATVLGLARDLAAQRRPIAGAIVVCEDAGDVVRFVEIACHTDGDDDRNPPCDGSHDDVFLSLPGRCPAHRFFAFLILTEARTYGSLPQMIGWP